ncbi:MAG: ornithine cyclodeaminase family protein [Thermoplasmata archaeon]
MRREFLMVFNGTSKILHRKRISAGDGTLDVMGALNETDKIGVVKHYFYGKNIDFLISLFSMETSEIVLTVTGRKLTRIRTAAATGLATDILSRKDSKVLGCIGSGFQAAEQIRAITQVRHIDQIMLNDLDSSRMQYTKDILKGEVDAEVSLVPKVDSYFKNADIIVTATTSRTPVIADRNIGDGVNVNSIGSYLPEMIETETATICRSRIVAVDSIEETISSCGELIASLSSGCISKGEINEFTDLVSGNIKTREGENRTNTYFKSIGVGTEDLVVARMLFEGKLA